jgi:hypothetical protein
MKRLLALLAGALVLAASAVPAEAAGPTTRQARIWQRACEQGANGRVSPQPALVCTHSGFPTFTDAALQRLRGTCERRLGGTFQYRSEYPVELALCSLN